MLDDQHNEVLQADIDELETLAELEASLEENGTNAMDEELAALMKEANLAPSTISEGTGIAGRLDDGGDELEALMLALEGQREDLDVMEMKKALAVDKNKSEGGKKASAQQLPLPSPSTEIVEIPPNTTPAGDSAYAHQVGYRLYKEGRLEEAKLWSRYAKTGSASSSTVSASSSSSSSAAGGAIRGGVNVVQKKVNDEYTPLEAALMKAIRALRGTNNKEPEMAKKEKSYLKHLKIIHEQRRIPKPTDRANVPKFEWEIEKVLAINELVEIPEDHVQVMIISAESLQAVLGVNSSKSISVHYNLGFPRDKALTGRTEPVNHDKETGKAEFHYQTFLSAKVNQKILKKKAEFTLVRHKGFWPFASEEVLGKIIVPLEPLSTRCECTGAFELVDGSARPKAIGGTLTISIRIRKPISGVDTVVADNWVLVIPEWELKQPTKHVTPQIAPFPSQTLNTQTNVRRDFVESGGNDGVESFTPITGNPSDQTAMNLGKGLSEEEKKDPLSYKFYIQSFDLLSHEIEELEKSLKFSGHNSPQNSRKHMERRLAIFRANKDGLEQQVSGGELDIESYLQILQNRVDRDKALVKYLTYCGLQPDALKVLRRMNIVNQEIISAKPENLNS